MALVISRLGVSPSGLSTWPMNGAVHVLNLNFVGIKFQVVLGETFQEL